MSGDLISRSRLMEEIRGLRVTVIGLRAGKRILSEFEKQYRESVLRVISEAPTAYDVDKVVERLEEYLEITWDCGYKGGYKDAILKAIEIIKAGGVSSYAGSI